MRRFARLAYRVARSNLAELSFPYRLTFAVTSHCQARCIMCNIWQKPATDELSLAEIEQIFSRYPRFSWVNLTGGEPFMRDDFTEIVSLIDRNSPELYLLNFSTNGYLTETIVAAVKDILARTKIPRLLMTVSLDGPRDLHEQIRGLPGVWDRAIATYRQLRELSSNRFSVYFGYTLQAANLTDFDATLAAARQELGSLKINEVHVNIAHISGHYYANNDFTGVPSAASADGMLRQIMQARKRRLLDPVTFLEYRYQRLARFYQKTGAAPLTCQAAGVSCFIGPEGTVFPCSSFAVPLGSLREREYNLGAIWTDAKRIQLRQQIRNGSCPGCWTPCEAYQTILANLLSNR